MDRDRNTAMVLGSNTNSEEQEYNSNNNIIYEIINSYHKGCIYNC
jgi:hypothetical protein